MKLNSLEIETSVMNKLSQSFSSLNERRCRKEPVLKFEDGPIGKEEKKEEFVSTQFFRIQK